MPAHLALVLAVFLDDVVIEVGQAAVENGDSLMAAVVQEIRLRMADRMRLEDTPSSPRDKLRAIGLGYIGFALAEPGWFDVAFASTRSR